MGMHMKTIESPAMKKRPQNRFFRFGTIRTRLLVTFILLVLLPITLVTVRTAVIGWRNGQSQVARQLESVVTLKEAEIERWLDELQMNITAVLANPKSEILVQILTTGEGEVVVVQEEWTNLIQYTGLFEELFLMDRQGQVLLTNGPTAVDTIHSNQAYFQQGLQGGFIHPPYYSPTLSRMSVVVVQPVLDSAGQVVGVLAGRASMTTLNRIMLERTGLGETGETYLVGANHALLTNVLGVRADVQKADSAVFIRSQAVNQALEVGHSETSLYTNYDQESVIGVAHWLPELQVALLAEQTQAEAFTILRGSIFQNIGAAIISLIAAISVAFITTRNLAQPLADLTTVAQQIANGDYTLTANIEREDEIGTLASAFNKMTAYLNQLITDLQQGEDRLQALLDAMPDMMYRLSDTGVVLDFKAAQQQVTRSLGNIVGTHIKESSLPSHVVTELDLLIQQTITSGQIAYYEYEMDVSDDLGMFELRMVKSGDDEVVMIVRDITERKRVEAQMQASLQEKEVLLKEIHHRVKNNLQVVSSLLDLQSTYVEDELVKEMFQENRRRTRSMAFVHEQLYHSTDLARINFADYVRELTDYLLRSHGQLTKGVVLDVDVIDVLLSVETAVPLGLIINELLSNAYKHAFPNGRSGRVLIQLRKNDGAQLSLILQDNGIGWPDHVDFRRSPSLGLTIIMTLVDQLQGEIEMRSQNGTCFELTFASGDTDIDG